jgi:hypothetical protein
MTEYTSNRMTSEQYEKCKNLIWSRALHYAKWSGFAVPTEELVAQGNLVFCECMLKWDESRGAFNTLLWISLDCKLQRYIKTWRLWSAVTRIRHKHTIRVKASKKGSARTMHNMKVSSMDVLYATEDIDEAAESTVGKTAPLYEAARFHEWIRSLSKPAQEVVSLVTDFPAETIRATGANPALAIRNAVFRHLSSDKGWHYDLIRQTFTEVQNALKEI